MCGEQGSCAREIAGKEKTPEPVLPSRLTLQKFRPQGVTRASGGGHRSHGDAEGGRVRVTAACVPGSTSPCGEGLSKGRPGQGPEPGARHSGVSQLRRRAPPSPSRRASLPPPPRLRLAGSGQNRPGRVPPAGPGVPGALDRVPRGDGTTAQFTGPRPISLPGPLTDPLPPPPPTTGADALPPQLHTLCHGFSFPLDPLPDRWPSRTRPA